MTAPLHLYALSDSKPADDQVEVIPVGDLYALAFRQPLRATHRELLLAFYRLLQSHWQVANVVPFRFGHVFATTEAVAESLFPDLRHWRRLLSEIGPCGELTIRTTLDLPEPPPDTTESPGAAYLIQRQQALRRRGNLSTPEVQHARDGLLAAFEDLLVQDHHQRIQPVSAHQICLELTLLIPRPHCAQALLRAHALSRGPLSPLGPFAPLSFARGPDATPTSS